MEFNGVMPRPTTTHSSLQVLRSEHRSIRAVLDAMAHFADEGLHGHAIPEPRVFRAMLVYIDVFAERVHHPKEERALFPLLRYRSPAAAEILNRLEADHARGSAAVHELEQSFLRWEESGRAYFAQFAREVSTFVSFYLEHLRIEERKLVPLAESALTEDDWKRVDDSFQDGVDPLGEGDGERDLRKLFTHITTITPAPLGVGDPLPDP
jgi:hemerythrin-like domain-containing protein